MNLMTEAGTSKKKKNGKDGVLEYAPSALSISEYVESRAREIAFMVKKYNTITSNKTTMQNLPRHMRRRAASHNVKRLPRRVRQQALVDMSGSGQPAKTKRPSRKHRRKPSNLLEDYVRRQGRCVWMETHIWHAKRFHMTEQWGYKIPLHPNDKSARASYRANNHFCIMQDISYWCCIEIRGPQSAVVDVMNRMTSKEVCQSVEAAQFLSGSREGNTVLYKLDRYPYDALGPARFLWRSKTETGSTVPLSSQQLQDQGMGRRQLWLWVHPSCHSTIISQLLSAFSFPEQTHSQDSLSFDKVKTDGQDEQNRQSSNNNQDQKGVKRQANDNSMLPSVKKLKSSAVDPRTVVLPFVEHHKHGEVEILSLKDNLVRFRLTGPLSNTVLTDLLTPADITSKSKPDCDMQKWWQLLYEESGAQKLHDHQKALWEEVSKVQSPGELPPRCVLGITVKDPRLALPRKKLKVCPTSDGVAEETQEICKDWPSEVCLSPLWDEDVRNKVKVTKLPDAKINSMRSEQLVPGTELKLGDEESRIPVMVVQNPGCEQTSAVGRESAGTGQRHSAGWGSGWDLILPSGWAMPFWVGLVYRGARTGGIREEQQLCQEMGMLCFPQDYPDTPIGQEHEQATRKSREDKYNRMPPAKRTNYIKMGSVAPYHCPWSRLLCDWKSLQSKDQTVGAVDDGEPFYVLRNKKQLALLHKLCLPQKEGDTQRQKVSGVTLPTCVLVPVQVCLLYRGTPDDFTMICIPSSHDLEQLLKDKQYGGPKEILHVDPTKAQTKEDKKVKKKTSPLAWKIESVRNSCSREIIGFVNHGGYSLSCGQGSGMGFVAMNGLVKLLMNSLNNRHCLVLLRTPQSLQYRYAYLTVNTSNK